VIAGRETKILIDQVRTIDVSYVAGELVDYLSRDHMTRVEHSLSRYFGLLRLLTPRGARTAGCGPVAASCSCPRLPEDVAYGRGFRGSGER
jgi:hypothetical protein